MIDCHVYLAERSRGKLMIIALKEVSSAKRLDALVTIVMFFAALQEVCFWILLQSTHHVLACFKLSNFASSTAGRTKLRFSFVDDNGTNRCSLKRAF
jgi:hypothetical protein